MEGEWEPGFFIFVRHPSPMILGKTVVESLEESADLVLIRIGPRKNYDGLPKLRGERVADSSSANS